MGFLLGLSEMGLPPIHFLFYALESVALSVACFLRLEMLTAIKVHRYSTHTHTRHRICPMLRRTVPQNSHGSHPEKNNSTFSFHRRTQCLVFCSPNNFRLQYAADVKQCCYNIHHSLLHAESRSIIFHGRARMGNILSLRFSALPLAAGKTVYAARYPIFQCGATPFEAEEMPGRNQFSGKKL